MLKKQKKGQLGIDIVIGFIIAILTVAVVGMATLIALNAVADSYTGKDTSGILFINETHAAVTETAQDLTQKANYYNPVCSAHRVINSTAATVIAAANYTTTNSGCTIAFSTAAGPAATPDWNNTIWNVSYSVAYEYGDLDYLENNVSNGVQQFFENAPTFFTLLAVVVIILIISLVIIAVRRFGGVSSGTVNGQNELGI